MYHIDSTVIIRNPSYPLNKLEKIDLESIILYDKQRPDETGNYVLSVGLTEVTVERCKAVLSIVKGTQGTAKVIIKERTLLERFLKR